MANNKTSGLIILPGEDLVATDRVVVLDRSATTGPGSGPEGTLKTIEADRVAPFGTTKGIVRNIQLTGIDTTQSLLIWVAEAINTHGPYAGEVGQDLYFRTYQVTGGTSGPVIGGPGSFDSVTIMYFKLLSGALIAGGVGNTVSHTDLVLAGGPYEVSSESNSALFLEIGDAGAGPIQTYFNQGDNGDPWIIDGQQFLTGTMNGESKLWHFLAGDGHWGGTSGNNTIADDFVDLSAQPPAPGFFLTKIHYLSLVGVDLNQNELEYIAEAVGVHGPFTCLRGQQMVFKTVTGNSLEGATERYYRLIPNYTSVGGTVQDAVPPHHSWFMPDGQNIVNIEDPDIIVELGDIGFVPVEDAFNQGDNGAPWDMNVKRFVRATYGGQVTLWAFVGVEGLYGGNDMGTDPDILEAFAEDFFNITDEPIMSYSDLYHIYPTIAELLAYQTNQTKEQIYEVTDASADPNLTFPQGETRLQAYYRYLGTPTGRIDDYKLISAPWAGEEIEAIQRITQNETFNVGIGLDFETIEEAINEALYYRSNGFTRITILIEEGYDIDSPIEVIGVNLSHIVFSTVGNRITATDRRPLTFRRCILPEFQDFKMVGNTDDTSTAIGIVFTQSTTSRIQNVELSGFSTCLWLDQTFGVEVNNADFESRFKSGSCNGIRILTSSIRVRNSIISAVNDQSAIFGRGVQTSGTSTASIENTEIKGDFEFGVYNGGSVKLLEVVMNLTNPANELHNEGGHIEISESTLDNYTANIPFNKLTKKGYVLNPKVELIEGATNSHEVKFDNIFGTWVGEPEDPITTNNIALNTDDAVNGAVCAIYYKGNVLYKTNFTGKTVTILSGENVANELCIVWIVYDKKVNGFYVNIQTGFTGDFPTPDSSDPIAPEFTLNGLTKIGNDYKTSIESWGNTGVTTYDLGRGDFEFSVSLDKHEFPDAGKVIIGASINGGNGAFNTNPKWEIAAYCDRGDFKVLVDGLSDGTLSETSQQDEHSEMVLKRVGGTFYLLQRELGSEVTIHQYSDPASGLLDSNVFLHISQNRLNLFVYNPLYKQL